MAILIFQHFAPVILLSMSMDQVKTFGPRGGVSDCLDADATTISRYLDEGQITAVSLMSSVLDRIEQRNAIVNAIVSLRDRDALLAEAAEADCLRQKGLRKGWLHGIPIAVKDLSNVAGIATTNGGSPLSLDFVPDESDPFVQRLQDAGAIVIGKTNTPENGLGSHTYNTKWGRTLNPYNRTLSAGGSSGGAAAAVASRMLPVADGSDACGSLRNPAGWNNLYSIRPTAGLVDGSSCIDNSLDKNPLPYPISTPGVLARSIDDLGAFLETMVGDRRKFSSRDMNSIESASFRIGWLGDWCGSYPVEDGILSLCQSALETFRDSCEASITIEAIEQELFPADRIWASLTAIRSAMVADEQLSCHGTDAILGSTALVRPELQWEVRNGIEVSLESSLTEAAKVAEDFSMCLEQVFQQYDALALPSAQMWPFPAEWNWPKEINGVNMKTYHSWMQIMSPGSLAGVPCLTIPAGFSDNRRPMGIQLLGKRGDDCALLRLGKLYDDTTGWPTLQLPSFPNKS